MSVLAASYFVVSSCTQEHVLTLHGWAWRDDDHVVHPIWPTFNGRWQLFFQTIRGRSESHQDSFDGRSGHSKCNPRGFELQSEIADCNRAERKKCIDLSWPLGSRQRNIALYFMALCNGNALWPRKKREVGKCINWSILLSTCSVLSTHKEQIDFHRRQ